MSDALMNAFSVLLIIIITWLFKRMRMLNMDTARQMANLVMYVSLPCAILTSANGINFELSLLEVIGISIAVNIILPTVAFFSSRNPETRMFNMLNVTCFNIGNFIIPFMQHSMSPRAFLALCMFDIINALFCFGGAYSIALFFNRKHFPEQHITISTIFKEMSKSLPSYVYAFVILLSFCGLSIPEQWLTPAETIAGANTFLCMAIIGIALNFNITKEQLKRIMKTWLIRYTTCGLMAVAVWFLAPLAAEVRFIIVIILFAPTTSLAPIFTLKAIPKLTEESADLNMVSIITSILMVTLLNSFSPLLLN